MGELFDDSHTKPKAAKPDSAIQEALSSSWIQGAT